MSYHVALSFSNSETWIATDIHDLLTALWYDVYCSARTPDRAAGYLRKELFGIYNHSEINVVLWSRSYSEKPNDSVVSTEKELLWERHIGRNEPKTLLIIRCDETELPEEFLPCLNHKLTDTGIVGIRDMIIQRFIEKTCLILNTAYTYVHPKLAYFRRGIIVPCVFRIKDDYAKHDPLCRWARLGDVEVKVEQPNDATILKGKRVFLIPGPNTPQHLHSAGILRLDNRMLKLKQDITSAFTKKFRGQMLTGGLFEIRHDGIDYPNVYCMDYEKFLNDKWQSYYSMTVPTGR